MTRKQSTTHRRLDPRREQRRRRLEKKLRAAERGVARGKIRRALQIYRALVAERPDDLGSRNRLGDLLVRVHQLDGALTLFVDVARELLRQGFVRRALALYGKILRHDPTHPEARLEQRRLRATLDLPPALA